MKYLILTLFGLSTSLSLLAQEQWNIDNPHSNIRFEVGWEDFSMRTGEFKVFEGTMITQSRDDLSDAQFELTVEAASVDVIADRLAGHVKSEKFLDVENYPTIHFKSGQTIMTGEGSYESRGILTVHGIEKEQKVLFKVKGAKQTKKGFIMGIQVTLLVNKMDYGLDWGSPRLADNIKLVGHLLYKLEEN